MLVWYSERQKHMSSVRPVDVKNELFVFPSQVKTESSQVIVEVALKDP